MKQINLGWVPTADLSRVYNNNRRKTLKFLKELEAKRIFKRRLRASGYEWKLTLKGYFLAILRVILSPFIKE